jgi:hypothetical protein
MTGVLNVMPVGASTGPWGGWDVVVAESFVDVEVEDAQPPKKKTRTNPEARRARRMRDQKRDP